MKPKPQYRTVTTREDGGTTAEVDRRFSLFYENVHHEANGLYDTIGDKNSWTYNDDKDKTDILHLPAENTIFINANIALTDGSSKKFNTGNKTPRTIPNLYDALTALAAKISDINTQIDKGCSTADKYLYVTKVDNAVTISPGNGSTGTFASNVDSESNIHITNGNNSTSITITDKDIEFTIKPNDNDTNSHTYTLGAIIEAIQELNRRTAFIDSTMTFSEAKNHFDVNEEDVEDAFYQSKDDELPAATNSHQGNLGPSNLRSIPGSKLAKMNIITYDPGTVDNSGKNIPFIQNTSTLNDSNILDDPTVISPESVSVRMRGCPYLLE